jgi:predicted nucleotidyltransferase
MRWLPEWLGKAYSKLWQGFGGSIVTLDQAQAKLNVERRVLLNILSRLVRSEYGTRVRRGEYQLWSPAHIVASVSGQVNLGKLANSTYKDVLDAVMSGLLDGLGSRLVTVAVFGSVARGDYHETSDIDIAVIVRDWKERMTSRVSTLIDTTRHTGEMIIRLWEHSGIYSSIQWYALDTTESETLRPLYLDMTLDAVIIYDRNDFFAEILSRLRTRLQDVGGKRIALPEGGHLWELRKGMPLSEVFAA